VSDANAALVQAAALPWRLSVDQDIEILLVTSRTSGRWIPPKGWPMKGKTLAEAAAVEAFEEAGVEGTVSPEAIGEFSRMKTRPLFGRIECLVMVHPLKVTRDLEDWPERSQRRRRWFRWEDAAEAVDSSELATLIRRFGAAGSVETRR
jgi:8-oxo-dGTP pyrophosphatase MutT (NUDIX family)